MNTTGQTLLLLAAVVIYFLPTYVAGRRRHRNLMPIFLMNLGFGITIVGWFLVLVWATTANCYPSPTRRTQKTTHAKTPLYGHQ